MAVISADFEAGTATNNIATGDTGSLTAWDAVTKGTTGAIIYDTTNVAHGSKNAKITQGATSAQSYLSWSTAYGTQTESWGRLYFALSALPTTQTMDLVALLNSGANCCQIRINTSGKVIAADAAGAVSTGTTTLSLNTVYRAEWHCIHSATVGTFQAILYVGDSTSASDTLTRSSVNTAAQSTEVRIGYPVNSEANISTWVDNIIVNAAAFPGPFPANTVAPTVSGSAPVGSSLTVNSTGTWNITPSSFTYQWTRDGSNIGGATSSSYTSVTADGGHAVGCKVTAVGVVSTETATTASSNTVSVTSAGGSQAGFRFGFR